MAQETIGFIGLGNIGKPMADNLARAGLPMVVYDIAGTAQRAPPGSGIGISPADVASRCTAVFLCLPTVESFHAVVDEIASTQTNDDLVVSNLSTVGPAAAAGAERRLREQGVAFVDSPISGSVFRAVEGTLTIMYSGSEPAWRRMKPLFEVIGSNLFRVGSDPGQGQRMKLVNNYLVISAFVITSEALAYGERGGLDLSTMLDIVNVSTGQNFVSEHMFPRFVLTGTFDSRGGAGIIRKDLSLFVEGVKADGRKHEVARALLDVLEAFDDAYPDSDQMRIYPFVRDER